MDNNLRPTSYNDLLKSFQQAEVSAPTPRSKKLIYRPQHSKQTSSNLKSNKQNLPKTHHQSQYQKSISQRSDWIEDDVLKQFNQKRKDRQLELTYNKFISYITNVLASLTGMVPPELLVHRMTYLQFLAALKEISMIKDHYQPHPSDSVSGLWNQLSGHGHTCGVFIIFISSILNMRKNDDQNGLKYAHLSKKYSELRYTRMQMQGKVKTTVDEQQFPFAPAISQRSRTLAASRSKSKHKRQHCQRSLHNLMDESSENNQNEVQVLSPQDILAGNRRSQILYKLAKQKSLEKKKDKEPSQIQYEKSIKQLTFHPRIHPNSAKTKRKKQIQGQQDSINRIIRGRVEREVRKIIKQKGLPYNEKLFQKMKKQRYEALQKQKKQECPYHHYQHQPTENLEQQQQVQKPEQCQQVELQDRRSKNQPIVLTIQVDENRCQKLVIQQPSKYKQAAAKFIKDLDLGQDMYNKLIQGVENALKFQLTQVDQDSCQSQNDSIQ